MVVRPAAAALVVILASLATVAGARPDEAEVQALVGIIRTGTSGERNRAVERLRHLQSATARRLLCDMLADRSPDARANSAWALGVIGDRDSIRPLVGSLDDGVSAVRLAAAQALGELRAAAAAEGLGKALDDPERHVRLAAVRALARITDARAIPPLSRALRSADVEVRLPAATSLGARLERRARSAIRDRLKVDPSSAVRFVIARALASDGDRAGIVYLCRALGSDADRAVRRQAATVLGNVRGAETREALRRALGDEDSEVRALARAALERRGELPKGQATRSPPASAPRRPAKP